MNRAWIVAAVLPTIACSWDWDRFEPRGESPSEVVPVCAADAAPGDDTAVERAHWKFEELTGVTAKDSSGCDNDLTLEGGPRWGQSGIGGYAMEVEKGDYAELEKAVIDTRRSYSVCAWVQLNLATPGQVHTFVSMDGDQRSAFFLQLKDGSFHLRVTESTLGGTETLANAQQPADDSTWYHVAGIHDPAKTRILLYVDGQLQEQQTFLTPWEAPGPTAVGRGKLAGMPDDFVTGLIDEVHLFQGILTEQQLSALASR